MVYDVLDLLPTYRQLVSEVCEELGAKEKDLVLDAGSGTGNLALKLKGNGTRVIALDYCREALEIHRSKDNSSSLILADLVRQLPFRDNCFDKIASNNTLFTLSADKQKDVLKEFHRVLKPGGKIVLANLRTGVNLLRTAFNVMLDNIRAEGLWTTAGKMTRLMPDMIKMAYYNWELGRERQHHRFELEEQKKLLVEAGFQRISETRLVYSGQSVLNSAHK